MTLATVALGPAYNPGSWSTFFTLTGTVAATLTGLFFVAFSLRLRDLQLSVVIRTRAAYLLLLLLVIVVYSAFVLMPGQSRAAVAAEILVASMVSVAYLLWCLPRLVRLAVFSADLVVRWLVAWTGLLLGIGAGISLLRALHLTGVWQICSAPRTPGGDSVQARRMPARSRRHW
jgi:hypothetical protein